MNRFLRRLIVVFFIVSCAAFAYVHMFVNRNVDSGGPEITMDQDEIAVSVTATTEDLLAGVTATDKKDGDVTDSLIIENMTNFTDLENYKREFTIVAFDDDGNVSKATRTLTYTDYQSPKFSMDAPLRFAATSAALNSMADHITATDVIDGDISGNISLTGADDVTVLSDAGTYPVEIQTYNSAGDTVVLNATVEFYDASTETVTPHVLLTDYIVYLNAGDSFSASKYIDGMQLGSTTYSKDQMEAADVSSWETAPSNAAPNTLDDVSIDNPVKKDEPGTYEVTYTMEGSGDTQGTVRLIVVVQ